MFKYDLLNYHHQFLPKQTVQDIFLKCYKTSCHLYGCSTGIKVSVSTPNLNFPGGSHGVLMYSRVNLDNMVRKEIV